MSKRPSFKRRDCGKLSFVCLDMYPGSIFLRLTAPISREVSGWRGTQCCLSKFDPQSAMSRGEVKGWASRSLPAIQEGTGHLMSDDTLIHHLVHPSIHGPILSTPSHPQNTPTPPHPHLHQVVCYDFMIIYGALSGCACTFTTPSWSPLITGPWCRQNRRDGGAC